MSQLTRECYKCKAVGKSNVQVILDGKDEKGEWIIKNQDGKPHIHAQGADKTFTRKGWGIKLSTNFSDGSHLEISERVYDIKEIPTKIKALREVFLEIDKILRLLEMRET